MTISPTDADDPVQEQDDEGQREDAEPDEEEARQAEGAAEAQHEKEGECGKSHEALEFDCERDPWIDEGHFGRVRFRRNSQGEIVAVVFQRTTNTSPVPPEMREIAAKANSAVTIIRRRFSDHADKETWLQLVCTSARMGTVGDTADPQAGLMGMARLEEMLVQAARPKRQQYIFSLFFTFLAIFLTVVVLYLLMDAAATADMPFGYELLSGVFDSTSAVIVRVQLATIAGLSLGVLFSGMVHNRVLSIETLEHFDPDGFSTFERLLYVWVIASTLEVFVWFKAIVVGVGGISFVDIRTEPWVGVLVGLVTAVSTEVVIQLIAKSAKPTAQRGS